MTGLGLSWCKTLVVTEVTFAAALAGALAVALAGARGLLVRVPHLRVHIVAPERH